MRISDWSSDVCSSDLEVCEQVCGPRAWSLNTVKTLLSRLVTKRAVVTEPDAKRFLYSPNIARDDYLGTEHRRLVDRRFGGRAAPPFEHQLGRASCREGGCRYV